MMKVVLERRPAHAFGERTHGRADLDLEASLLDRRKLALSEERASRVAEVPEHGPRAPVERGHAFCETHGLDHLGGGAHEAALSHVARHLGEVARGDTLRLTGARLLED